MGEERGQDNLGLGSEDSVEELPLQALSPLDHAVLKLNKTRDDLVEAPFGFDKKRDRFERVLGGNRHRARDGVDECCCAR